MVHFVSGLLRLTSSKDLSDHVQHGNMEFHVKMDLDFWIVNFF